MSDSIFNEKSGQSKKENGGTIVQNWQRTFISFIYRLAQQRSGPAYSFKRTQKDLTAS